MLKNLFQALITGIFLLWSWPGIENPLGNNRLLILGVIVAIITFRFQLKLILNFLSRTIRRFFFFNFHKLLQFFLNKSFFQNSNEQIVIVPAQIDVRQSATPKTVISQIFNLGIVNEVRFTAQPDNTFIGTTSDLNDHWRLGIHFSEDPNVQEVAAFKKPLIHLTKDEGVAALSIVQYNSDLSQEASSLGQNALYDKQSPIEVLCKYTKDGILIRFSIASKVVYEKIFEGKFRFIKCALWTDFKDPAIAKDQNGNNYHYNYWPIHFKLGYKVEKA